MHSASRVPPRAALLLCGYAVLALGYLAWIWSDQIGEFGGDSAMYMLMARHYSPFWPHSDVLEQAVRGAVYPPLFPLLIGLLGGGMLAAHLLVWACLLGAIGCLYGWLRQEGLSPLLSAWATLLFALMPCTLLLAFNIWSEIPCLLLSLAAILCDCAADREAGSAPRMRWAAAAAVAAAGLVRTAALPLLIAFAVRLLARRPRHWPGLLALAAAPSLLWMAWSRLHRSGVSGYYGQWLERYGRDPLAKIMAQLRNEPHALRDSWMQAWFGTNAAHPALVYLILAVGAVCLLGCAWRLWRFKLDAVYTVLYLAQLFVWPFQVEAPRLSYVLIPVLLGQGLLLVADAARLPALARPFGATLLAVLSLVLLPGFFLDIGRYATRLPPAMEAAKHTTDYYSDDRAKAMADAAGYSAILADLRDVNQLVPAGECVFATKPTLVTLYSGRLGVLTPPDTVPDAAFEQQLRQCSYGYLMAVASPSYPELLYPMERIRDRAHPLADASSRDGNSVHVYAILVKLDQPAPSAAPP